MTPRSTADRVRRTARPVTLTNVTADVTCTITNKRRPTVTVVKALSPAGDAGRFDLRVGSTVVKAGAGDGEQGSTTVTRGSDVTVSEAATAGTDADKYASSIDCGSGSADGTTRTLANVTADVTCTITNTRKSEPAPPPPPSAGTTQPPPPVTTPAPCSSARRIVVHVRGHYQRGTAKVAGRTFRFKVSRNRARVAINLAGLAKGTYRVRIELRSRNGRTVKQVRTYRICWHEDATVASRVGRQRLSRSVRVIVLVRRSAPVTRMRRTSVVRRRRCTRRLPARVRRTLTVPFRPARSCARPEPRLREPSRSSARTEHAV